MFLTFLLVAFLLLFIDIYAYRGLRRLFTHHKFTLFKGFVLKSYWLVDVLLIAFSVFWSWYIANSGWEEYVKYRRHFLIMGAFLLVFLPKFSLFVFTVIHDFKQIFLSYSQRVFPNHLNMQKRLAKWRSSRLVPAMGFLAAAFMFSVTLHGVGFGRFDFRIERVEIWFDNLPADFDGLRMVHFSDTHLGSFSQVRFVEQGLQVIQGLEPDIIVFTGDMVNNNAREAKKFVSMFSDLYAPLGKFSVLGNHDMGDYRSWGTIGSLDAEADLLVSLQRSMGFEVLLNEHRFIHMGNDSIMIVGVENWGLPPFSQYGDLEKAMYGNEDFPFAVLLSHDPSHWREQVLGHTKIPLTLSGHTHGMQFGISNRFLSWSPVQLKYNEWSGLYKEGEQKLYVNRGFGFVSFPGRIGMPPEITLITMRVKEPDNPTASEYALHENRK